MKAGKLREGQLRPLKERMTQEQRLQRAAKTEVRRLLSLEHAKTRGLAVQAFNNTVALRTSFVRASYVGIAVVIALIGALAYLAVR